MDIMTFRDHAAITIASALLRAPPQLTPHQVAEAACVVAASLEEQRKRWRDLDADHPELPMERSEERIHEIRRRRGAVSP